MIDPRWRGTQASAFAALLFISALVAGCSQQSALAKQLAETPVDSVEQNPALLAFALDRGEAVFQRNCASCHGVDRKGIPAQHTPDLTDNVWLFSGDDLDTFQMHPSDIEKTILYGIRTPLPQSRNLADMIPHTEEGRDKLNKVQFDDFVADQRVILQASEIEDLTQFLLSVGGQANDAAASERGRALYYARGECFDCHAADLKGDGAIGSADLTTPQHWLYGTDHDAIYETIAMGRSGVSPAFEGKLAMEDIKAAAIYVMHNAAH